MLVSSLRLYVSSAVTAGMYTISQTITCISHASSIVSVALTTHTNIQTPRRAFADRYRTVVYPDS